MGRGTRKSSSWKAGVQLDSREVIFKSKNNGSIVKQEQAKEKEKFSRLREEKESEQIPPSEIDSQGNRYWRNLSGRYHRDGDLPAIEFSNGTRKWYQNGDLHRKGNLPAIEWANGTRDWYRHGQLHRENDLPAVEDPDGSREWYQRGNLHRDGDLPAREHADGTREWWRQGNFIRQEEPKEG